MEEVEIEIARRDFIITKREERFVTDEEMSNRFFMRVGEFDGFLEIIHVFDEIRTYPYSQDDTEVIFFCYFGDTVHTMKSGICTYTAKTFCYNPEIVFDSFRSDVFFIFIQTVLIFVGIIADAIEFIGRGLHFPWSINITPPTYIEYKESQENTIFYESIFEHRWRQNDKI